MSAFRKHWPLKNNYYIKIHTHTHTRLTAFEKSNKQESEFLPSVALRLLVRRQEEHPACKN